MALRPSLGVSVAALPFLDADFKADLIYWLLIFDRTKSPRLLWVLSSGPRWNHGAPTPTPASEVLVAVNFVYECCEL